MRMTPSAALRGFTIPFLLLLFAFVLLVVAGMRGSLGPFDLTTASWIVAAQWVLAPVVGGLLMRHFDLRDVATSAAWLGITIGLAVVLVLLPAAGTASEACRGAGGTVVGYMLGCIAVAALVGIGIAASLLLTARMARRDLLIPAAVLAGAAVSFASGAGAVNLYYGFVACLR
jgi:hypothetical protein